MNPFTTVESWSRKQDATSHLAPSRQEPFIGVQPPNCVEAESADTVQTKITKYIPPTIEEEFEDNKARKAALKRKSYAKHFEDVSGDAPDGMQWAQQTCGDFMKKVEANEFRKESKEHPTFSSNVVKQIVKDHAVSATAENPSGASGSISTSGGGMELGPLKMQAPNINAGGQADKETMGTITKAAGVAAGNPAAAIADNSRRLGGQIMYDQRYAVLSPKKGKMGEGPAGKPEMADGILDTISSFAGPATGILTGNPLLAAGVGATAKGTTEAMKGEKGDILGGATSGGISGGIAGLGTGLIKPGGLMGSSNAVSTGANLTAPPVEAPVPTPSVETPKSFEFKPAPSAYTAPPPGPGEITVQRAPTFKETPIGQVSGKQQDWLKSINRPGGTRADMGVGTGRVDIDSGTQYQNVINDPGGSVNVKSPLASLHDDSEVGDACDKFMRQHTSEEEMLNNAIPAKKSPAPEDLGQKINKKPLRPGADDSGKMLLTSAGGKQ
jgi:hypothetical protein